MFLKQEPGIIFTHISMETEILYISCSRIQMCIVMNMQSCILKHTRYTIFKTEKTLKSLSYGKAIPIANKGTWILISIVGAHPHHQQLKVRPSIHLAPFGT